MTWGPRYLVRKAPDIGGTPIAVSEPCLVIRAQDVLAVAMLDEYLAQYLQLEPRDPAVVHELRAHREALLRWQRDHPTKVADR